MLSFTIFFIGLVLGLRFKVLILVPALVLTLALVGVNGNLEDGVWRVVGTMVAAVIFLQLGYVGGSALRFVIGRSRAANHGGASTGTSTDTRSSDHSGNRGGSVKSVGSEQARAPSMRRSVCYVRPFPNALDVRQKPYPRSRENLAP